MAVFSHNKYKGLAVLMHKRRILKEMLGRKKNAKKEPKNMLERLKNWINKIKKEWKEVEYREKLYDYFRIMEKRAKGFNSLWKFCISNNRVCPMPSKWNDLFNMLKNKKGLDSPLILNGWEMSSPLEKQLRFEDHIKWAAKQDQLDEVGKFLRALPEKDWAHYGEI